MASKKQNPGSLSDNKVTQEALQQALQDLYNQLNDAYWVATTIEGKDLINGCAQALYQILTQLAIQKFTAGTPEFIKLKGDVDAVNKKLDQLKQQIDSIIHQINTATSVIAAINKAVGLAAPFFV